MVKSSVDKGIFSIMAPNILARAEVLTLQGAENSV
jgi:hypothetical protein